MRSWPFLLLCLSSAASAQERINPSGRHEVEVGAVPLVGGDTDVGVGAGFLGSVALPAPEQPVPFDWRFEGGAFLTVKNTHAKGLEFPYFQGYLSFAQPALLERRLRLDIRLDHVSEANMRYFGIGNASVRPAGENADRDLHTRKRPTLSARGRLNLPYSTFAGLGASVSQNWISVRPSSILARDLSEGPPEVRRWLRGTNNHGVLLLEAITGFDTRDNSIDPSRGQYHQLTFRASPRVLSNYPFPYQQLNAAARFYFPVSELRSVLVFWATFDALIGSPPFYELARFDETFAIGGNQGVRGVPGQRYYGTVKAMNSVELRTRVAQFSWLEKPWAIGIATFADSGRLWADFKQRPELDGSGLGLKYGIGAGLRVHQGKTFVVRADVAWSPDARPIGAYVLAGHSH